MGEEKLSRNEVIRRALAVDVPQAIEELVVDRVIEAEDAEGNTRTVEFMKHLPDEVQE